MMAVLKFLSDNSNICASAYCITSEVEVFLVLGMTDFLLYLGHVRYDGTSGLLRSCFSRSPLTLPTLPARK